MSSAKYCREAATSPGGVKCMGASIPEGLDHYPGVHTPVSSSALKGKFSEPQELLASRSGRRQGCSRLGLFEFECGASEKMSGNAATPVSPHRVLEGKKLFLIRDLLLVGQQAPDHVSFSM